MTRTKNTKYDQAVEATRRVCSMCNGDSVAAIDTWREKWGQYEGMDPGEVDGDVTAPADMPRAPICYECHNHGTIVSPLFRCPACHGTGDAPIDPGTVGGVPRLPDPSAVAPPCHGCNGRGVASLNLTSAMKVKIADGLRRLADLVEGDKVVLRSQLTIDEARFEGEKASHWLLLEWVGQGTFPSPPTQKRYEICERLAEQVFSLADYLRREVTL